MRYKEVVVSRLDTLLTLILAGWILGMAALALSRGVALRLLLRNCCNPVFLIDLFHFRSPVHLIVLLKYSWPKIFILNQILLLEFIVFKYSYNLVHDAGCLKMPLEFFKSLNTSIFDITSFLWVEICPFSVVELFEKVKNE